VSADLLRRAAAALRQHATDAEAKHPAPWHASSDSLVDSVRTEGGWALLTGVYTDTATPVVAYAALMHPPVAAALAEHLEKVALDCDILRCEPDESIVAVARAVLREEQ
jgi:hypothetical protein